jgi:ATP-binding cassette, subfamily B, bacterial MsbA
MSNTQTMTNYQLCQRLMGHLAPYRLVFTLILLATILMAITDSVIPIFIKPMLDSIFVSKNYDSIQLIPLIFIVLFLVRNLSDYISSYGINWIGNTLTVDLQTTILNKFLMLPTHYYEGQTSENLVPKLTSDITLITQDGAISVIAFVKNAFTIIGLLIWMFYLNWELSLLTLMIASIVLLSAQLIYGQSQGIDEVKHQITENFTQLIKESTENHKTIALDGGQRYVFQRFQDKADQIQQFNIKHTNTTIFKIPLILIVVAIALSTILYLAIQQTFTDGITIGSFVSFIVSTLILFVSLKQITKANRSLQNSLAATKDIFSVLDLETEPDKGKIILDHVQGELRFEHVSFYSDLKDFSLTIRSGERVAVVGSSDEAISALVNLIPRFILPTDGEILLDNHELTAIKLDSLRSKIGLLSQETTLFNDSIASNIAYGKMGYSTENEIISAAHAAHAIEFIRKMPQGMQTIIGKHGIELSKEQCQHIVIARTLLKNPPILILDEIATVLDSESEYLIRSALNNLMCNRTTIIIARRKATLENVDRIIVIERNRIVEVGNHQELLSEKGLYTKFYPLYY